MNKSEIKKYLLLISYAIILFLSLMNIGIVFGAVKYILKILSPILIGIAIAFILNILLRLYEEKLLNKFFLKFKNFAKLKRPICVILTYISLFIILAIIFMFIIPQISKSISALTDKLPSYTKDAQNYINDIASKYVITENLWNELIRNFDSVLKNTSNFISTVIPRIFDFTKGITTGAINLFLGFVLSFYMLVSKEKLIGMQKKIIYAYLKHENGKKIIKVFSDSNKIFRSFIGGQLIEAVILGVLCFLGMSLFRMPYAPLISVIIGLTSLIPVLGAYIGTIPSAILILLENPTMSFWFIIFIIILQQLEGNLIYPKVVGNAVGLNGLWVLFAIIIGGNLFGVAGILLGVPTLAVLYSLFSKAINKRIALKEKSFTGEIE